MIRAKLKEIAREQISYAAALFSATYFREAVGNVDLMPRGCNGKSEAELTRMVADLVQEEQSRVSQILEPQAISAYIKDFMDRVEASLNEDDEEWKRLIPGKIILGIFCNKTPLPYENFRNAYIIAANDMNENPFSEIIEIFKGFDERVAR
jgi:hypothetical protein